MNQVFTSTFLQTRKGIYLTLGLVDTAFFNRKNTINIFSYHSISDDAWRFSINAEVFKKQIEHLLGMYEFITFRDLEAFVKGQKQITKPSVILNFDDGYKDIMQVKEFLKHRKIRPAVFLLADSGHPNTGELGTKRAFLSKNDIRSLLADGWEIGSHSNTHANLTALTHLQLKEEIIESKHRLEKTFNVPVKYFAYPRGKYDPQVLNYVKQAGYTFGLTMDDGVISGYSDPYTLPRIGVDRTHSFAEFRNTFLPTVVSFRQFIKRTYLGKYL